MTAVDEPDQPGDGDQPDRTEPSAKPGEAGEAPSGFRSGFVAIVGRPNTGKSTLLNQVLDRKVTIVSDKAQTTRHQIRGVLTDERSQIVFVDTPGISKPRTALGTRLNETAGGALSDVDVVCFVIDGRSGFGRGDRFLAERLDPERTVVVVNKICLLYTSPSPRDGLLSRMPSSA